MSDNSSRRKSGQPLNASKDSRSGKEFQRKNSAMGDLYGSIIDKPRTSPAKTSVLGVSRSTIQGSRHVLGGSGAEHSRPGVAGKQSEAIKVFDDEGNDVTPLPLLAPPKGFPPGKAALTGASGSDIQNPKTSIDSAADVFNRMETQTLGSFTSAFRSQMGDSYSANKSQTSASDDRDDDNSSVVSGNSDGDDEYVSERPLIGSRHSASNILSRDGSRLTETDLDKLTHINLNETEMIWILDLPSIAVSNDNVEEAEKVKKEVERYKNLKATRVNNDNYVSRGMQTFNNPQKSKDLQATAVKFANANTMATTWLIHDAFEREEGKVLEGDGGVKEDFEGANGNSNNPLSVATSTAIHSSHIADSQIASLLGTIASLTFENQHSLAQSGMTGSESIADDGVSINGTSFNDANMGGLAGVKGSGTLQTGGLEKKEDGVENLGQLNQSALASSLLVMERAILSNNYHDKLLMYKDLWKNTELDGEEVEEVEENADDDEDDELRRGRELQRQMQATSMELDTSAPSISFLWSYRCELTRGRSVSYMSLNKQNTDIIAVAYGECKHNPLACRGLILCWSIKNPEWPERIYKSNAAATALDFAKGNPNLLAVGFEDGVAAIYDVRSPSEGPVLENSESPGKHHDPIWELKWIDRERVVGEEQSRGETLVTVSTDGRVTQHIIRKGLEYTDLMLLKRVTKQENGKAGKDGKTTSSLIARQSGGLCFDFNPTDNSSYLVGTEDGQIQRCSCSYNEQYLMTYNGHTEPVYRVRWNPFHPSVFLSCSSDWSARIWNSEQENCILKLQSGKDTISDVTWSPACSTVFATVSTDGRLEVWDLTLSTLDPTIHHVVLDRSLTSVIFANDSPCIITGDENGSVDVYMLKNIPFKMEKPREQEAEVLASVLDTANKGISVAA